MESAFWGNVYLLLLSLAGFFLMGWDKRQAALHRGRISELTLLAAAAIGGSAGIWIGMYLFRHKTRKPLFSIGVPVILLIQLFFICGR